MKFLGFILLAVVCLHIIEAKKDTKNVAPETAKKEVTAELNKGKREAALHPYSYSPPKTHVVSVQAPSSSLHLGAGYSLGGPKIVGHSSSSSSHSHSAPTYPLFTPHSSSFSGPVYSSPPHFSSSSNYPRYTSISAVYKPVSKYQSTHSSTGPQIFGSNHLVQPQISSSQPSSVYGFSSPVPSLHHYTATKGLGSYASPSFSNLLSHGSSHGGLGSLSGSYGTPSFGGSHGNLLSSSFGGSFGGHSSSSSNPFAGFFDTHNKPSHSYLGSSSSSSFKPSTFLGSSVSAPSSSYGPPSYSSHSSYPSNSYGTPSFSSHSSSSSYAPSFSSHSSSPSSSYGLPSFSSHSPSQSYGTPSYTSHSAAPSSSYGPPSYSSHSAAPSSSYGSPSYSSHSAAPSSSYGSPSYSSHSAIPSSSYGPPAYSSHSAAPSSSYGTPSFSSHSLSSSSYAVPSKSHGSSHGSFSGASLSGQALSSGHDSLPFSLSESDKAKLLSGTPIYLTAQELGGGHSGSFESSLGGHHGSPSLSGSYEIPSAGHAAPSSSFSHLLGTPSSSYGAPSHDSSDYSSSLGHDSSSLSYASPSSGYSTHEEPVESYKGASDGKGFLTGFASTIAHGSSSSHGSPSLSGGHDYSSDVSFEGINSGKFELPSKGPQLFSEHGASAPASSYLPSKSYSPPSSSYGVPHDTYGPPKSSFIINADSHDASSDSSYNTIKYSRSLAADEKPKKKST